MPCADAEAPQGSSPWVVRSQQSVFMLHAVLSVHQYTSSSYRRHSQTGQCKACCKVRSFWDMSLHICFACAFSLFNWYHMQMIGCRGLDDAQFALLLTAKHSQRLLAFKDPGQCLNYLAGGPGSVTYLGLSLEGGAELDGVSVLCH